MAPGTGVAELTDHGRTVRGPTTARHTSERIAQPAARHALRRRGRGLAPAPPQCFQQNGVRRGDTDWAPELAVGVDLEALGSLRKLLAANHGVDFAVARRKTFSWRVGRAFWVGSWRLRPPLRGCLRPAKVSRLRGTDAAPAHHAPFNGAGHGVHVGRTVPTATSPFRGTDRTMDRSRRVAAPRRRHWPSTHCARWHHLRHRLRNHLARQRMATPSRDTACTVSTSCLN